MSNFVKIGPVGTEFPPFGGTDGWTDGQRKRQT